MNVNISVNQSHQTSLIKRFTSFAGKLGSRAIAPVSSALNITKSTYQRINQSVVGGYLINSIQENILECAGALGVAALGEWWLGDTMEGFGSEMGYLLGMITSVGVGVLMTKLSYSSSAMRKSHQSEAAKIGESALIGTATSVLTGMVLPGVGSRTGAVVGRAVGSVVGAQVGSIIGGFAAIKINGSEEVLINTQEPLDSYAIKALQSSYVNGFLGRLWLFNPVVQAVQDQAVGSLAYHSLTVIKPTVEAMQEGRLLDDLLVHPSKITSEEKKLLREKIKKTYENPAHRQAVLTFAMAQGIQEDVINPFLSQDLDSLYSQLDQIQSQGVIDEKQFLGMMMHTLKKYLQFIFKNPEIQKAHQSLISAFFAWQSDREALADFAPFKQAKENLLSILEEQTTRNTKNQSLREEWDEAMHAIDKDKGKEWIDTIPNVEKAREILNEKNAQELVNQFMTRLEKLEEHLFAYPLTNENLKTFVQEVVNIHVKSFNLFLVVEMVKPIPNQNSAIMRKNYQLFGMLLANYYYIGVDKRLPAGVAFTFKKMIHSAQLFFNQQIQTAKLKKGTLSHFIDLKS